MTMDCRIHSVETCGTVDGPGVRTVVFFQGCLLRCLYCHNPDTRALVSGDNAGTPRTTRDVMTDIHKYKSYAQASGGGVTFTGGEPLLQAEAVSELAKWCRSDGIHTALDTSGFPFRDGTNTAILAAINAVDLVLLDIKCIDPAIYHKLTGVELEPTLAMARHLAKIGKPTWIRYVLVPGWTDQRERIEGLADFVKNEMSDVVEKVEVLPFHKLGEFKWRELNLRYELSDVEPPSAESVAATQRIFANRQGG
ncbi:MAG: pyruvate formate lyase-activating protein [Bdellovibrio sp.]|nr:MAG: pyruvate formate lyase-activating protein [Bdellovibrio sp.]